MTRSRALSIAVALFWACGDSPAPAGPTFDADLRTDASGADAGRDASSLDADRVSDAMIDGASDDAGEMSDAATPVACETPRQCATPASGMGAVFSVTLPTGVEDGNVLVHAGVATAFGPVIPWGARQCCGADPKPMSAGIVRLGEDMRSIRLFEPILDPMVEMPPAIAHVGASLWVVDPLGGFARAASLDVDTLTTTDEIDVALGPELLETPALASLDDGGTLALVSTATSVELRVLGADGALVSSLDLERRATRLALTPTCLGFLATWEEGGDALALPIARDGTPMGEARVYGETALETQLGHRTVVFDGAHVVTVGPRHVYELEPDGSLAVATLSLVAPVAAVGTDDGLVVMQLEATDGEGAPVVLVERETGAFVRELARVDTGTLYASDGTVVVTPGAAGEPTSLHFVAASYGNRGQLTGARIDCR